MNNAKNIGKLRHSFIFIVGLILTFLCQIIINYLPNLIFLIIPLIMPVIYVINILQNLDNLNLFNQSYFWTFHFESKYFLILGIIYFFIILTLLSSTNDKVKKTTLKFLLAFYTLSLISNGYYAYIKNIDSNEILLGSGNLLLLLARINVILVSIFILTRIEEKVKTKFLIKTFKKYIFTISEVVLSLLFALAFKKIVLDSNAGITDLYSIPLFVFMLAFFLFLFIELAKDYFLKRP